MSTVTPTPEEMEHRIARFDKLRIIKAQAKADVPQDVMDLIYSRELKPVVTLGQDPTAPFGSDAPIVGAAGISITYALCPNGTGPSLHSHKETFETFTVMEGKFQFFWGDEGEHSVILERFDALSVPPSVNRAFKCLSEGTGILQVVISGGVHDARDIAFPKKTASLIRKHGEEYLDFFKEEAGLTFE